MEQDHMQCEGLALLRLDKNGPRLVEQFVENRVVQGVSDHYLNGLLAWVDGDARLVHLRDPHLVRNSNVAQDSSAHFGLGLAGVDDRRRQDHVLRGVHKVSKHALSRKKREDQRRNEKRSFTI